jgi:hypothetical protein
MLTPLNKQLLQKPVLVVAALALASGAALQAGTSWFSLKNQTEAAWILGDEGKGRPDGAWTLDVSTREPGAWTPGPMGTGPSLGVIAAGATVLLRLENPAGTPPPAFYLQRQSYGPGAAAEACLPLFLDVPHGGGAAAGSPEAPLCLFILRPEGTLERWPGVGLKAAGTPAPMSPPPAAAADALSPPRVLLPRSPKGNSPAIPLPIQGGYRTPQPLGCIPLELQKNTLGKPVLALANRSSATWYLWPSPDNGPSHLLNPDGSFLVLDPTRRFQIPPGHKTVVALASPRGMFVLTHSTHMAPLAVAVLTPDETYFCAPHPAFGAPPPRGIFEKRPEDTQSFIIKRAEPEPLGVARKDGSGRLAGMPLQAFPASPAWAPPPAAELAPAIPVPTLTWDEVAATALPGTASAALAQAPGDPRAKPAAPALEPETLSQLLELEETMESEMAITLVNRSGATWYLEPQGTANGDASVMNDDQSFEVHSPDRPIPLPPGSMTVVALGSGPGTFALRDAASRTRAQAWVGHRMATFNGPDPDGPLPTPVQRVSGCLKAFVIGEE